MKTDLELLKALKKFIETEPRSPDHGYALGLCVSTIYMKILDHINLEEYEQLLRILNQHKPKGVPTKGIWFDSSDERKKFLKNLIKQYTGPTIWQRAILGFNNADH